MALYGYVWGRRLSMKYTDVKRVGAYVTPWLLANLVMGCASGDAPESSPSPEPTMTLGPSLTPVSDTSTPDIDQTPVPSPTEVPEHTGTPLPTPYPTPTSTPGGTETPAPTPTPHAEPTSTAAPTPTSTPQLLTLPVGAAEPVLQEYLVDLPLLNALPLADGLVLLQDASGLWTWDELGHVRLPLSDVTGTLHQAAVLPNVGTLVCIGNQLYVFDGVELSLSPLSTSVASTTPIVLQTVENTSATDVWLVASSGFYLYRGTKLYRLELGSIFDPGMKIAAGPAVNGVTTLWLATSRGLYSLTEKGGKVSLTPQHPAVLDELKMTDAGTLYGLTDGILLRRKSNASWRWMSSVVPLESLAPAQGDALWLLGLEQLFLLEGDRLLPQAAADDTLSGEAGPLQALLSEDAWGRPQVLDDAGLWRFSDTLVLAWRGINTGQVISMPLDVKLLPAFPASVTYLSAATESNSFWVDPATQSLTLDPIELGNGAHTLQFGAEYGSRFTSVSFNVTVSLPVPTWGEEILNIYDEHCVYCHGPEGGAHPLYNPEQWQNEIDLIIGVTASGYMPLSRPPLTEEEVYTLRAWQAAEFPE